jgi:hypothetical protein
MHKTTYQTAVTSFLSRKLGQATGALTDYAVIDHACEVDRLIESVASSARSLATDCERYAQTVADAHYEVTPPTHSSRIVDLTRDSARLAAKRESLFALLSALYGPDACKQVRADLQAT